MPIPQYRYPSGLVVDIPTRIKHLRRLLTIHSYLYYILDKNAISDDHWQALADELTVLQENHPQYCKLDLWDKYFEDWNGSTGMHLCTDYNVARQAHKLWESLHEN